MAFAESDRVQIRLYLGYPQIWLQADPRLENAITNIQAVSDGGTRPNPSPSAAEVQAKALVTQLQNVDAALTNLQTFVGTTEANGPGGAKIDAAREDARLRATGRMLVNRLAGIFDTVPGRDVFSSVSEDEFSRGMRPGPFGGRGGY
jgi:hypothetical protein